MGAAGQAPVNGAGFEVSFVNPKERRVPAEVYDKEYLLSDNLEGYEEFSAGQLSAIKTKLISWLELGPTMSFCEIGYGRGEFLLFASRRCATITGIDYSEAAFAIARETLKGLPDADIRVADCRELPFDDESFDRVFSGDVIEHQNFADGGLMLMEAYCVLKPGGFLLIHTSPNTVFTRLVYPLVKAFLRMIDNNSVDAIEAHLAVGQEVHVFEFSLWTLRRIAPEAGLENAEVWLDRDLLRSGKHRHTQAIGENPLIKWVAGLGRFSCVRFFLGNDLYLKCRKPYD